MIKENQRLFNIVNVLSDGIIVLASILLAQFIGFSVFIGIDNISTSHYLWVGVWAAILFTTIYMLYGLYESHRSTSFYKEASRLLGANILGTLILLASLYVFHLNDFSRLILLIFFACSSGLLLIKRCITRMILRHLRKIGFNNKHIVLVGHGATAQNYFEKISANPEFGFIIDGYVSSNESLPNLPWLGSYHELGLILETFKPDEVVLALPSGEENFLPPLTAACEKAGVRLSMISCYMDFISSNPRIVMLDGLAMINIRHIPLDNIGNALIKRISDLIGSVLLVILTSPLMLFTAVGVKLSSHGPIIFKQERVGKDGKHFCIYKFRSMYIKDEVDIPHHIARKDCPTKFGGWIRKYSIDELPQLFNVIKGNMSIVGPRPEIPYFVEQFREQVPRYMIKHHVLPGMTGWAQVNGLRGNTPIPLRIEYDLFYIENWNILMDLKILWMTLFHLSVKQ